MPLAAVGAELFPGDTNAESDDEACDTRTGVANPTAQKVMVFAARLTPTGKLFAELLAKVHGGMFDDDFLGIADAELKAGAYSFAFGSLFDEKGDSNVETGLLRTACLKWVKSTYDQPVGLGSLESGSAIGDADRIMKLALDGGDSKADGESDKIRKQPIQKLNDLLAKVVSFGACDFASNASIAKGRKRTQAAFGASQADNSKSDGSNRILYFAQAALFPEHENRHNDEMFRGSAQNMCSEFKTATAWMMSVRRDVDVVIVSDGRGDGIRNKIRKEFESREIAFVELWVIYESETAFGVDVRHPKRKLAWSGSNMETLFVILPGSDRRVRALVKRDTFNKCG